MGVATNTYILSLINESVEQRRAEEVGRLTEPIVLVLSTIAPAFCPQLCCHTLCCLIDAF